MQKENEILKSLDTMASLREELDSLITAKRNVQEVIRSTEMQLRQVSQQVTELEQQKVVIEKRYENSEILTKQNNELAKKKELEISDLSRNVNQLQEQYNVLKSDIQTLQANKVSLEEFNISLSKQNEQLRDAIPVHEEKLKILKDEFDNKNSQYKTLTENFSLIELKHNSLNTEYNKKFKELEDELAKRREECNKYSPEKMKQEFELLKLKAEEEINTQKEKTLGELQALKEERNKVVREVELKKIEFLEFEDKMNDTLIRQNQELLSLRQESAEIDAEIKRKKAQDIMKSIQ